MISFLVSFYDRSQPSDKDTLHAGSLLPYVRSFSVHVSIRVAASMAFVYRSDPVRQCATEHGSKSCWKSLESATKEAENPIDLDSIDSQTLVMLVLASFDFCNLLLAGG